MNTQRPLLILGLFLFILTSQPTSLAVARTCGKAINCNVASGGAKVGLTEAVMDRAKKDLDIRTGKPNKHYFEYKSEYSCSFDATAAADVCLGASTACDGNTPAQGLGPPVRLYRRQLDASGAPTTGWQTIGMTCFPELVPGKRGLDIGQVRTAFRNTAWAKPTVHIQPEGNVTLVTLPTYFAVTWPKAGFQPGEIDSVTLLGYQVRIRPTVQGYTYVFGDGTDFGPTASPGGPYPNGDITHVYPKAGNYKTRIDITYGGEFSIGAGPWVQIPDSVTVPGPDQLLKVKTARARLVTR
jgi:hypothetical protein